MALINVRCILSNYHIILASASPRRLALLRAHGIEPELVVPDVDEEALRATWPDSLLPEELAEQLALAKARAVYEHMRSVAPPLFGFALPAASALPQTVEGSVCTRTDFFSHDTGKEASTEDPCFKNKPVGILAADTIVFKEGVGVLGKPSNRKDALLMLQALCNTSHKVFTGVALIDATTGEERSLVERTTVRFGAYSTQDIEDYLIAEPPFDKAGSYAIQGIWAQHVEAIDGDLENVIGLPCYRLEELISGSGCT